ncbi:MAG: hypothetical protein M3383_05955, partial [Actinomycetota bacterium]|nr:hypothetical protein [Actinomycetota bacterium]
MGIGVPKITAMALCAAALVACAVAPSASAEPFPDYPIKVEVRSASQQRILNEEKVRIRARVPIAVPTRWRASSRDADGRKLIGKRRLAPRLKNRRRFAIKLTDAGLARIARCTPQRLKVRAREATREDVTLFGQSSAPLVLDSAACDPGADPSNRVYGIAPVTDATHTNGTPRDLAATGTGDDRVRLALFACDNVAAEGGELVFAAAGGVADRGSPAASLSEVKGAPTQGSPQEAGPLAADSGDLDFEITGKDGCAFPIVFRDGDHDGALDVDSQGIPTEPYGGGGQTTFEDQGVTFQDPGRCDPLDPAVCLQPFPSDHFTVADPATDTGKRIALQTESMPASNLGVHIDAREWRRNDGFSPGSMLVTRVPGLDSPEAFEQTDPVPITDIERSFEPDAPIVVIDADTGERHLIWSELDANPTDPADVNLLIRPAVNFKEGHRYIVALRRLRDAGGNLIGAQRPFQLYRDRVITSDPAVEERRDDFEEMFTTLGEAGISRTDLYLSWDFTIASERSLSERMLSIRDDAFAQLGDTDLADMEVEGSPPAFVITSVTDFQGCGNDGCQEGLVVPHLPIVGNLLDPVGGVVSSVISPLLGMAPEDDQIARKVEGQMLVPCYTSVPLCGTGFGFGYSSPSDTVPDRLPGNVALVPFTCQIPRSVTAGGELHQSRPSLYGHGLLGSGTEVDAGNIEAMSNEHNFTFCATDWAGFADQDLPTILLTLQDLSNFPKIVDRTQQGFLNFLYLGRAMIHPQGLGAHPAFQSGGRAVIDNERLFYDGNSQGGIFGGALTAVAPDFDRAVLGVPGMNYSTLLRRSVDFEPYAEGTFVESLPGTPLGLYDRYPNELERPLILALIQMLWDRGETNGYAHHMTDDPYPNTPPHEVLMQVAFGDHQVSMWTAEVEARTIGAATNPRPLEPGRHPDLFPLFDIPRIDSFATTPYDGSALIYFDSGPPTHPGALDGVVPPPTTNTPPRPPEYGG